MATAAPGQGLPMLYNDLVPLSSQEHATWKLRPMDSPRIIANVHAVPITIDEFTVVQRFFPIVFSVGADMIPLALMGLNEGVNTFVDADGNWLPRTYLPAFVRRYPFLLARVRPDSDELSLCFDPASGMIGDFEDGLPLFADGEPTQVVKDTLSFCEQFEIAAQRTQQFGQELQETGLVEDGEVNIQHKDLAQPTTYRGFRMVNEEKMRDLRGDQLRKMSQSGMLTLLYAHLFSLPLTSEIFNRQIEQNKFPGTQSTSV
jgi:hypothetical protein